MPRVSVIVPVYNGENLLLRCADSLLRQTVPDWECLLIDDGSTDSGGALCDDLAARDNRFRVFHKANGGVSAARNLGLDQATGEFVTFLDQDDRFSPFTLEFLLAAQQTYPESYVLCLSTEYPHALEEQGGQPKLSAFLPAQVGALFHHCPSFNGPWCKLFRRELLQRFGLRFPETVRDGYEDRPFVYTYLRSFWQTYPRQPVVLVRHSLYLWEQDNPASVSKRSDRVLQLRHLAMFDGLLNEAIQTYGAPAAEMSDYAREYLHTLVYGASLLPEKELPAVMRKTRSTREYHRLMAYFRDNRIYTPYYLPLRLHMDRLACALCRSHLQGGTLYKRLYGPLKRLSGPGWQDGISYRPLAEYAV